MSDVLVVDDDDAVCKVLCGLLSENHRCQVAPTAEAALERLNSETFDVILTDISMPGRGGLSLIEYVRRHHPVTPVIVITGNDYQQHGGELIRMGAFDYLMKPFRLEEVTDAVDRALERRRGLRAGVTGAG